MNLKDFQARIDYKGDIVDLLSSVVSEFGLGEYIGYSPILVGYEDFNIMLDTSSGKYFVKLFANFRTTQDIERYIAIMQSAISVGVNHPQLYEVKNRGSLFDNEIAGKRVRLAVMEFIEGESFYDLGSKPTEEEISQIVDQVAKISKISIEPREYYDEWAITHFLSAWKDKSNSITNEDRALIEPLIEPYQELEIDSLPKGFVHGDIIMTNVIKGIDGKIYLIDFSVANRYPRIQELAVLLCNLLWDDEPTKFKRNYNLTLLRYEKQVPLSEHEKKALPLLIRVAHAMHVLCASYEREVKGNTTAENEYWIDCGQRGLNGMVYFDQ